MPRITVTMDAIKRSVIGDNKEQWQELVKHYGKRPGFEQIPLLDILETIGFRMATDCFLALDEKHNAWARLTLCDIVEPALALTDDPRPGEALDVARRHARGKATNKELEKAMGAAWLASKEAFKASAIALAQEKVLLKRDRNEPLTKRGAAHLAQEAFKPFSKRAMSLAAMAAFQTAHAYPNVIAFICTKNARDAFAFDSIANDALIIEEVIGAGIDAMDTIITRASAESVMDVDAITVAARKGVLSAVEVSADAAFEAAGAAARISQERILRAALAR